MSNQANLIGSILKAIRAENKLTQGQMADQLELKRSRLGSYEEGRAMPDVYTFLFICKKYNKNPYQYFEQLKEARLKDI